MIFIILINNYKTSNIKYVIINIDALICFIILSKLLMLIITNICVFLLEFPSHQGGVIPSESAILLYALKAINVKWRSLIFWPVAEIRYFMPAYAFPYIFNK